MMGGVGSMWWCWGCVLAVWRVVWVRVWGRVRLWREVCVGGDVGGG